MRVEGGMTDEQLLRELAKDCVGIKRHRKKKWKRRQKGKNRIKKLDGREFNNFLNEAYPNGL